MQGTPGFTGSEPWTSLNISKSTALKLLGICNYWYIAVDRKLKGKIVLFGSIFLPFPMK